MYTTMVLSFRLSFCSLPGTDVASYLSLNQILALVLMPVCGEFQLCRINSCEIQVLLCSC